MDQLSDLPGPVLRTLLEWAGDAVAPCRWPPKGARGEAAPDTEARCPGRFPWQRELGPRERLR